MEKLLYCKHQLVKYKPWHSNVPYLLDEIDDHACMYRDGIIGFFFIYMVHIDGCLYCKMFFFEDLHIYMYLIRIEIN